MSDTIGHNLANLSMKKREVGDIGESSAARFLEKRGFKILDRNYLKKWGEIDIIAMKDKVIHFVEVKTSTSTGEWRPEDNVHPRKLRRLSRAIRTYLAERRISHDAIWQVDVLAVHLDFTTRRATIRVIDDVVL